MSEETKKEEFDNLPNPFSLAQMKWITAELQRAARKSGIGVSPLRHDALMSFLGETLFAVSKLAALSAGSYAKELNADVAEVVRALAEDYTKRMDERAERLDVLEARLGLLELRNRDRDADAA